MKYANPDRKNQNQVMHALSLYVSNNHRVSAYIRYGTYDSGIREPQVSESTVWEEVRYWNR